MADPDPITLTVVPHPDNGLLYMARWEDGEAEIMNIPEIYLDLIPYMIARVLLSHGYNAQRGLVVRLHGADYDLLHASIGAAAATPLPNTQAPVSQMTHAMFARSPDG